MPESEADVIGNADLMVQYVIPKLTDHKDVLSLQTTSKELRSSTSDNSIWLKFLLRSFDLYPRPDTCTLSMQRLYRKLCTTSLEYPVRFVGAATTAGIDNNDGIYWVDHMFCPNHWGAYCSKKLAYTTCVGILQADRVRGDMDELQHRNLMIDRLKWQWVPGPYAAPLQTILEVASRRLGRLGTHWLDRTFHDLYVHFQNGMPDGRVLMMHADQLARSRNLQDREYDEYMKKEPEVLARINATVIHNQQANYMRYVEGFAGTDGMELYDRRALHVLRSVKAAAQVAIIKRIQVSREGEFSCPVRVGAVMMGLHGAAAVSKEELLAVQNHPAPSAFEGVTTYKQILEKVESGELPPVIHHTIEQYLEVVEFAHSHHVNSGGSSPATKPDWINRPLQPVLWFRFLSVEDRAAAAAAALASDDDMSLMSADSDDELAEALADELEEGAGFMDDSDEEHIGALDLETSTDSDNDDEDMEAATMDDSDFEGQAAGPEIQHPYAQMLANNNLHFAQQFAHMLHHLQQNGSPPAAAAPSNQTADSQSQQPSTSALHASQQPSTSGLNQSQHRSTSRLHQLSSLVPIPIFPSIHNTSNPSALNTAAVCDQNSSTLPPAATDAMLVSPQPSGTNLIRPMLVSPHSNDAPPFASHPIQPTRSSSGGSSPQTSSPPSPGPQPSAPHAAASGSSQGTRMPCSSVPSAHTADEDTRQPTSTTNHTALQQLQARPSGPSSSSVREDSAPDNSQPRIRQPRPTLDSPRVPPPPAPPAGHEQQSQAATHPEAAGSSSRPPTIGRAEGGAPVSCENGALAGRQNDAARVIKLANGETVVEVDGRRILLQNYGTSVPSPILRQVSQQAVNHRYNTGGGGSSSGAAGSSRVSHAGHAMGALVSVAAGQGDEDMRGKGNGHENGRESGSAVSDAEPASGNDQAQGELQGLPPLERARACWRSTANGGDGGSAQAKGDGDGHGPPGARDQQQDAGPSQEEEGQQPQSPLVDDLPEVQIIPAPDPDLYRRLRKPESSLNVELKLPRATNLVTVQLIDCEDRMAQFDDQHDYTNIDVKWVAFLGYVVQFPPGTEFC